MNFETASRALPTLGAALRRSRHQAFILSVDNALDRMRGLAEVLFNGTNQSQFTNELNSFAAAFGIDGMVSLLQKPSSEVWRAHVKGAGADWWTRDYMNWFATWSMQACIDLNNRKGQGPKIPLTPEFTNLIDSGDFNRIVYDRNGTGRPFLPGLFMICLCSKFTDDQRYHDLKVQFESKTGISFEAAAMFFPDIESHFLIHEYGQETRTYMDLRVDP